jgi:hypothetical protein
MVLMSAIVFDGDQPRMTPDGPDFISVVMHTSEVGIIDTWDSLGMRGTDSHEYRSERPLRPRIASLPFRTRFHTVRTVGRAVVPDAGIGGDLPDHRF